MTYMCAPATLFVCAASPAPPRSLVSKAVNAAKGLCSTRCVIVSTSFVALGGVVPKNRLRVMPASITKPADYEFSERMLR